MKSPKQRFLDIKQAASQHRDIVDNTAFAVAMDMALLQVVWELPQTDDMAKAAANHWRLHGALTYMNKLAHLGDSTPEKPKVQEGNLNWEA